MANYCTATNDDSHSTVFSSAYKNLYILHLDLPSGLRFRFLGKHIVRISHSPSASHHLWFDESNHIWNGAQIIYLFIMWFPPSFKYLIPCRSKEAYSPQHCSEAPLLYILPFGLEIKFYNCIKQLVNCRFVYFKPTFTVHTREHDKSGTEQ